MPEVPNVFPSVEPARLRIGDVLVEVPTREITPPDAKRPRRVTPKAMGVLRVLAASPGQVVSRSTLLAQVWPDTLPTDDVLTQAVTQLRKAFGSDGKRYIETIAKSGYRLVAPVEYPATGDAPPASADEPARAAAGAAPAAAPQGTGGGVPEAAIPGDRTEAGAPRPARGWRKPVAWVALGGLAFMLGALATVLMREDPAPQAVVQGKQGVGGVPSRPYRLITSAPGFELWPSLSPDASMIAYSAALAGSGRTVIQVQPTTVAQPRPLSRPPATAVDSAPEWSPDGREIGFLRRWEDGRCAVMIVAANGAGSEREALRCDGSELPSFSWTPDQSGLVLGTMTGDGEAGRGVRVFDLASGQRRQLVQDAEGSLDYVPKYSPDGRWVAFVRNPQLGDVWRVPAEGGEAEQLTSLSAEIRGWSWLPDGKGLVFSRRIDSGTRLFRLDIASGEVADLGLEDAQAPDISTQTGALAFVQRRPRFGIFRIPPDDAQPGSAPVEPERLFASSGGRDGLPVVSPDGRQLTFSSDRTGHFELWWAELDAPQTLRPIEGIHPDNHTSPVWSPDSSRLLVAGWDGGDAADPAIFEVVPATGQSMRLPVPVARPLQAAYLPDPSRLLVTAENRHGEASLILFDRSRQPWRELRAIDDVSMARLDPDADRVLFTRLSEDGLWQADLALSPDSVRRLDDRLPSRWRYRTWAVAEDGSVAYLHRTADCPARLNRIGGPAGQARCLDREHLASVNGFSVDPRTGDVYVALAIEDGTDIAFMPQPVARPGLTASISKWLKSLAISDS